MQSKSIVQNKSYSFALSIVRSYKSIQVSKKEFILSKQLLRSGTSICANISEGEQAQSRNDFISKMSIALKEAHETEYWLNILKDTEYLSPELFSSLVTELIEIIKLLTSIIKTSRK